MLELAHILAAVWAVGITVVIGLLFSRVGKLRDAIEQLFKKDNELETDLGLLSKSHICLRDKRLQELSDQLEELKTRVKNSQFADAYGPSSHQPLPPLSEADYKQFAQIVAEPRQSEENKADARARQIAPQLVNAMHDLISAIQDAYSRMPQHSFPRDLAALTCMSQVLLEFAAGVRPDPPPPWVWRTPTSEPAQPEPAFPGIPTLRELPDEKAEMLRRGLQELLNEYVGVSNLDERTMHVMSDAANRYLQNHAPSDWDPPRLHVERHPFDPTSVVVREV